MKDEELTFQEFFADFPKKFPYIDEPEEPTMDKKLIINVATTGAFLSKEANPNQAFTPQEIANEVIDSCKAGAAMWHVHCRDEHGRATSEPEIIKKTCDMVFEQAPDVITSVSVWSALGKHGADLISPLIDALLVYGKKYTQTAVIPASSLVVGPLVNRIDRETLTSIAEYLNAKGVKPEFQGFTFEAIENIRKFLVEPGLIQPPYFINAIAGSHAGVFYETPTTPYLMAINYIGSMLDQMPPNTIKGATVGGHNWLPMVIVAIILGVDCVRIGMEDTIWMYPHKPDKIKKCADVVRKVATIARELGRDVATPDEAREILGMKK